MKTFYYLRIVCFLSIIFFCNQAGMALETSWKGTAGTSWFTAANWTNGVPTALLDVVIGDINFTGGSQPIISGSAATAKTIKIGETITSQLTVNSSFTVGNVYIRSNGTLIHGNTIIYTSGNWENDGTYTANSGSAVTFNGAIQYLGGSSLSTFRTLNINPTNTVLLTSNIGLNASGLSIGVINVQTGTFDLSTFLANRATGVAGGTLKVFDGASIKVGGTNSFPANYATYTLQPASTVEYDGTNQAISGTSSGTTYGNLVLSTSGGTVTKTVSSNISVNGFLNIGESTTLDGGNFSLSVTGNWINEGTFTAGTSTVIFRGASGISGNPIQNFYNLRVTGTLNLLNSGNVQIHDLDVREGGSLSLQDARLQIAGIISNAGTFDASAGTLEMNGTASQTIPADIFLSNALDNLVINNSSAEGVILSGPVDIYGSLTYLGTGRNLATNDFLTLKSTDSRTAYTGDMTGNTIAGKITVERYIPAHRAWRLLTSPVELPGSQTIHDAWQEGVNNTSLAVNQDPYPGYGTHITFGKNYESGFDVGVNNNPGIKAFNTITNTWDALDNTDNTSVAAYPAYMLFVRGDRSINLSERLNAFPTPTILRSSGYLKTGDQGFSVSSTGFTVISNPYASGLDINEIAKSNSLNIQDNFYLWDPRYEGTNGVGGFVNFSWDSVESLYTITPFTGTGIGQYISSGGAFIAKSADSASLGFLIIKETYKVPSGNDDVSRPMNMNTADKMITNLYSVNTDGTESILDGVLNKYGVAYSNAIDNNDAVKFNNMAENLATLRDGKLLTVERRQPVTAMDTISYRIGQMKAKTYNFEFTAGNLGNGNLIGVLEDNYLHTTTPVDLNGTTNVNFTITGEAASSAEDRFRLVFRPLAPLPLTLSNIKAWQQEDGIKVEWKIENGKGIKQYEVERSTNGINFTGSAIIMAGPNNDIIYSWLDANAQEGTNYYRIKSTGENGEVKYSQVVKVNIVNVRQRITLNTNIITNNIISWRMENMPKGKYSIRLLSSLGQNLYTNQIDYAGGNSTQTITIKSKLAKGICLLEFTKSGEKKITEKVLVE